MKTPFAPFVLCCTTVGLVSACSAAPSQEHPSSTSSADTGVAGGGFLSFGGEYGVGQCLDIKNDSITEGNYLDSWTCNGTAAQSFILDGTQIHPAQATGWCIDVQNANYAAGVVQLWPCGGQAEQQWVQVSGTIRPQADQSVCLNLPAESSRVSLTACNGSQNQLWFPWGFTVELQSSEVTSGHQECLDVWQDTTTSGTRADDYVCNTTDAQVFTFSPTGQIKNHGLCLGVPLPAHTGALEMLPCDNGLDQRWQYEPGPNGTLNLWSTGGGLWQCLDVLDNSPTMGTTVDLVGCNDTTAQQWSPIVTGTTCGNLGEACCTAGGQSQCGSGLECSYDTCIAIPPPPLPSSLSFDVSGSVNATGLDITWGTVSFTTSVTVYPSGEVTWSPSMHESGPWSGYDYSLDISFPGYSDALTLAGIVGVNDTTNPPGTPPIAAVTAWVKANYASLQGATLGWSLSISSDIDSGGHTGSGGVGSVCSGGGTYSSYPACCFCGADDYIEDDQLACDPASATVAASNQHPACSCYGETCPAPVGLNVKKALTQ